MYDVEDRNKLNIQSIKELKEKLKIIETEIITHLKILNDDAKKYKTTIQETFLFVETINNKMKEIEIHNKSKRKLI